MTNDTVFEKGNDTTNIDTNNNNNAINNDNNGVVDTYVGEGKKYSSVDELAQGYQNADAFIDKLKEENAELRTQQTKQTTVTEVLDAIKTEQKSTNGSSDDLSTISEDEVAKIAQQTYDQQKQFEGAKSNILKADKMLKDIYGDKAQDIMNSKGSELGLGPDTLQDLAAKSPTAFINLVAGNQKSANETAPTTGSVNSDSLANVNQQTIAQKGTYTWYQELKKNNPSLYNSSSVQNQMMEDARTMGRDAFFNT